MTFPVIVWFRDDLRLADNPTLTAALKSGQPLVCCYVLDQDSERSRALGGASRWWLAGSLRALGAALRARGGALVLRRGAAAAVIPRLMQETGAAAVHCSRRYDRAGIAVDHALTKRLGDAFKVHDANLLFEPGTVRTKSGTPFEVFTPFWRAARNADEPRPPLPAPKRITHVEAKSDNLDDWQLEPMKPDWAGGLRAAWTPGEDGARSRLAHFVDHILPGYAQSRERPDRDGTSRLSPHLRFGEISPFQLRHAALHALDAPRDKRPSAADVEKFLAELGWREFSYALLARHGDLATQNLQRRFDRFRWRKDDAALRAWQRGMTGYPYIDAAMRQLWATGWMHNRARMAVASFLVKHLLVDWRAGETWFWDTLVDADPANNPASWQWVAGCGADAAPFFRIFNPVLQGEKFDPDGDYVKQYVPELGSLPKQFIHRPWDAPPLDLAAAGVVLGQTYPERIVDHAAARARALAALRDVNTSQ